MKFIDLVDGSGKPTKSWSDYRSGKHKEVLAQAIRKGYSDLFATYSDANARSSDELSNIFRTASSAGAQSIRKTLAIFNNLCAEAEFGESSPPMLHKEEERKKQKAAPQEKTAVVSQKMEELPAVHLDIQVHISADSSAEQIEKIFECMAKYIYRK